MKRFSSLDSLGTMPYSPEEEKGKDNLVYSSEFQAMLDSLDDEGCIEESGLSGGKKRRLSIDQVQALEKIFEVDNKLDPERKVKLAQELGLQPRQVAIWFQNRRARWKTKQLERDYNLLKAEYENLQLSYNKVEQEKQKMVAELKVLKEKLGEESLEWKHSGATATPGLLSSQNDVSKQCNGSFTGITHKPDIDSLLNKQVSNNTSLMNSSSEFYEVVHHDIKDGGSSDSESSGINERSNLNSHLPSFTSSSRSRTSDLSPSYLSSSTYYPQLLHSRPQMIRGHHQQHSVKMEELSLFSSEDSHCNIFSVDQAPNLYWYFPDQRS